MLDKILCACTGKECEGICRKEHLYRKRKWTDLPNVCPSSYIKREEERRKK